MTAQNNIFKKLLISALCFLMIASLFTTVFAPHSYAADSETIPTHSEAHEIDYHDGYIYTAHRDRDEITRTSLADLTVGQVVYDSRPYYLDVMSVAVNSEGDLFYTKDSDMNIYKISNLSSLDLPIDISSGKNVEVYATANVNYLYGLAFDAQDILYFTSTETNSVYRWDGDHATLVAGGFTVSLYGLAFSPSGDLYVLDRDTKLYKIPKAELGNSGGAAYTKVLDSIGNWSMGITFLDNGQFVYSNGTETIQYVYLKVDSGNNSVSVDYPVITAGKTMTISAHGDREDAEGMFVDDEQYIPFKWSINGEITEYEFDLGEYGNYISQYIPANTGNYTITVSFQKRIWDGTEWKNAVGDIVTKQVSFLVDPAVIEGPSNDPEDPVFTSIAAGYQHVIALDDEGRVWAWGYNYSGQLGDGSREGSNIPVQIADLANIKQVAAGSDHSAAIDEDGSVWVWGGNNNGQLGIDSMEINRTIPVKIEGLMNAKSIALGEAVSAVLKEDGTVWTFGYNGQGQLGIGTDDPRSRVPVQVAGLSDVKAIAVGSYHMLALKEDGTVWAWGSNNIGQLGTGDSVNSNHPVKLEELTDVKQISAGYQHSAVLLDDGTVRSWGQNGSGQLGNGSNDSSSIPAQVTGIDDVSLIAAGGYHTVVMKNDGSVWSWGLNNLGQLGNASNETSSLPVQVKNSDSSDFVGAILVALGDTYSLALKADGTVVGWGNNGEGQLGNGNNTNKNYVEYIATAGDDTAPEVDGLRFQVNDVTATGLTLGWDEAMDNMTVQHQLEYSIYQSTDILDVGSITSMEQQAIFMESGLYGSIAPLHVTGLSPDTTYYFNAIVRDIAGNESAYQIPIQVKTNVLPIMGGSISISGDAKFGESLTVDTNEITYSSDATDNELLYQWFRDGIEINGATGSSYTLTLEDIGTVISVEVMADSIHAAGITTGVVTGTVTKADAPLAPPAPIVVTVTDTSVTLNGITGMEYSRDGGLTWQDSPIFEGLVPNTNYSFEARMKETATQKVSSSSPVTMIRTEIGERWVKIGSESLKSIAYGNGIYVALTTDDLITISTDLKVWQNLDITQPYTKKPNFVKFVNGRFIIGTDFGTNGLTGPTFWISEDGENWHQVLVDQPAQFSIKSVAYGNGTYVASTFFGDIITSVDGITWSDPVRLTGPMPPTIHDVEFMNGVFVAGGSWGSMPGDESDIIATSLDGSSWKVTNLQESGYGETTIASNGEITLTANRFFMYRMLEDDLGKTTVPFARVSGFDLSNLFDKKIVYVNADHIFVLVGNEGKILTSSDADVWEDESITGSTLGFADVIEVNGTAVAVGPIGIYKRIPNFIDETAPVIPDNQIQVTTVTTTGITLYWEKATDDGTDQNLLEYVIYQSSNGDIETVSDMEANGTPVVGGNVVDTNTFGITDLLPNTTYYFNVLVKDSAGNKSAYQMQSITTAPLPELGGTVEIDGEAKYGETLTVDISGITYTPDASGDIVTYQWFRDGIEIVGATGNSYTLAEEDIAGVITVEVIAGGTEATGNVISSGTSPIAKADAPAAPAAPSKGASSTRSITLSGEPGLEYSLDGGVTWQGSTTFDGLEPETDYTFISRVKETDTQMASEPSGGVTIRTDALPLLSGSVSVTGEVKYGETLTVDISALTPANVDVTYQWLRDGEIITGVTGAKYILGAEDIGTTISVNVIANDADVTGSVTGNATDTVEKADAPGAPPVPTKGSTTTASITLSGETGLEYSLDGGVTWQDSSTFNGLKSGTEYTFISRVKETAIQLASEPSDSVTIRTENRSSGGTVTEPEKTNNDVDVLVNGKVESAGTLTTSKRNNQTVTTVSIDQKKLQDRLEAEGAGAVVTIPVKQGSNVVVGELDGQMVKNMEGKQAVLEIQTEQAAYTLPAVQINIDAISEQIGKSVALEDIKVRVEIAEPDEDMVMLVENAAEAGTFALVAPPINFTIRGTYEDASVDVTSFNAYVERMIAIPEGVDPNKITTGIVIDPDGTVRHVPTQITAIDGKYYAKINSLTNSTYSVIWHPLEFSDMAGHWAKNAVNDMGSRMVVNGVGHGKYDPDADITRAEFAAIVVRGLGLKPENGVHTFQDVAAADWYSEAIQTASAYGLINGYEDGTFRPNDRITREQAMAIIARAMQITGLKDEMMVQSSGAILQSYVDAEQVSNWALQEVADNVQAGIVSGRNANTLAPNEYITRAEVAVVIQRLLQQSNLI